MVRTVPARLVELYPCPSVTARPFVVWLWDPEDDGAHYRIRPRVERRRDLSLALERFRCLRVVVSDLPEGEMRKRYTLEAGIRFYDPAGRLVRRPLIGRHAGSTSKFAAGLEKAWAASYEMSLVTYLRRRHDIQDRSDRNLLRQYHVRRWLQAVEWYPSPAREARGKRELARLARQKVKIDRELGALIRSCRLRSEWGAGKPREIGKPRLR